jgi:hypothetical protein
MTNRGRTAAKLTGVAAAAALVFGVIGPAGAATQNVEYRLDADAGGGDITLPTSGDPVVIDLLAATGVTGTWDDVTGAFTGSFETAPIQATNPAPSPAPPGSTIDQTTTITSPANGVTGTIDPATGTGTLTAPFDVSIYLASLTIPGTPPTVLPLDFTCTMPTVNVTYNVVATKVPADSLNFTNLTLTSQPFTVGTATCVGGPNSNPALHDQIQNGLNTTLALPNSNATSSLALIAGAVPPPPVTTTTTIPATTTTTAAPSTTTTPAAAVTATVRFTG